jgi:hypothetical protein
VKETLTHLRFADQWCPILKGPDMSGLYEVMFNGMPMHLNLSQSEGIKTVKRYTLEEIEKGKE